jgi:hypothetical protein
MNVDNQRKKCFQIKENMTKQQPNSRNTDNNDLALLSIRGAKTKHLSGKSKKGGIYRGADMFSKNDLSGLYSV